MTHRQDAYIVAAVRTPVGKAPKGMLSSVRPDDLLAFTIKELMKRVPSIDLSLVDDVIVGCAMPEGSQGMNIARISALMAGLPDSVPGMTINRFCSSGLQSIALACDRIALGEADVMIAGGVESMSQVPLGGFHYRANPKWFEHEAQSIAYNMGITAEKVAEKYKITREMQDAFALRSHTLALDAQEEGYFDNELTPFKAHLSDNLDLYEHKIVHKSHLVKQDEGPRRDTTLEGLSKLSPVFKLNGTVTAGNTSQRSDGAAALLIVSEKYLTQYDLHPLARFKSYTVAGVPPEYMGIGPIKAIPKALRQAGLKLQDMSWIELNEAFAAQALSVIQELNLDIDKVNPEGGAIALGHPLGATGSIRACTLIHGMRRTHSKYGMVTMCIGTGMGAAGIFEAM